MTIAENIKTIRKEKGLTQKQLAEFWSFMFLLTFPVNRSTINIVGVPRDLCKISENPCRSFRSSGSK